MMALVDMRPQGLITVGITRSHSRSCNHNIYYELNSSATRVSPIRCCAKEEEEGSRGGERRISSLPSSPSSEKKRFKLADREPANSQTIPFELPKISIGGGATLLGLASDISRLLLLPRQALGFDISALKRRLINRKPTRKQRGGGDEKVPLVSNILEGLSQKPPSSPGPRCNWPRGTLDPIGASNPTRASTPTSVSDPTGVSSPHCNWPRKTLNPIGATTSASVSSPARVSDPFSVSDPIGVSSPHCNWPRKILNPIGATASASVSSPTRDSAPTSVGDPTSVSEPIGVSSPHCNWPRKTLNPIGATAFASVSSPVRDSSPFRASDPTSVSDPIGLSSPHCNWPRKTLNPIGATTSASVSSPARDSTSTRASDPTSVSDPIGVSSPHCNWPRKTLNPIGASTSTRVSSGYSIAVVDASPIMEILPSGPHCPWPRRLIGPTLEPEKAPEPKLLVLETSAIQGGARCAWPRASVPATTRDSIVAMESAPSDSSSSTFNGNYSSTEVSPSSLPRRMLATGVGLGLINRFLLLQGGGGGGFALASPSDLFDIGVFTSNLSDLIIDKEEAETESTLDSTKNDLAGISLIAKVSSWPCK